jgi:hypothetical protein
MRLSARITRESAQCWACARAGSAGAVQGDGGGGAGGGCGAEAGANRLAGTVTRAPRASGGEVAMQLAGGLQLVGFADAGSGLRGNALCALAAPQVDATPETLLATLLRADIRVGTSTPRADPSGDYAWALFRKADALQPGAYAVLDAKALKLTGSADSPTPPPAAAPMPG